MDHGLKLPSDVVRVSTGTDQETDTTYFATFRESEETCLLHKQQFILIGSVTPYYVSSACNLAV
jgi:hypothetical protein